MNVPITDHYEILGVARAASSAELKSAYLRLIREFTPENDPERFRLISEAYRTLSHPDRRAAYDREAALPASIESELEGIERLAADGDLETAAEYLGDLWEKHRDVPGSRRIGFLLGVVADSSGDLDLAIETFETLTARDPDDLQAATWLGDAHIKNEDHEPARRILKEVIVRDKDNTDAYISLSRSYFLKGELKDAVSVLDRGIQADGVVDIQDLPMFAQKLLVIGAMGDWSELEAAARQLAGAVPAQDQEARSYAAAQLAPVAEVFLGANRLDLCHFVLEVTLELDPSSQVARDFNTKIADVAASQRARPDFYADDRVALWLKALIAMWSGDHEASIDSATKKNVLMAIARDVHRARRDFYSAEARHRKVLAPFKDQWRELTKEIEPKFRKPVGSTTGGDGCLIFLAIMAGMAMMFPLAG
jgi:curved DNA-binding protein CbpA